MNLTPTQPKFFVVQVFDRFADEIAIGGIFSKREDAEQYRVERLEDPNSLGVAVVDEWTMDEIKTALVKDRLLGLAAALERAAPNAFNGRRDEHGR